MSGAGATVGQTAGQLPVFCLAVLLVMTEPGLVCGRQQVIGAPRP